MAAHCHQEMVVAYQVHCYFHNFAGSLVEVDLNCNKRFHLQVEALNPLDLYLYIQHLKMSNCFHLTWNHEELNEDLRSFSLQERFQLLQMMMIGQIVSVI